MVVPVEVFVDSCELRGGNPANACMVLSLALMASIPGCAP